MILKTSFLLLVLSNTFLSVSFAALKQKDYSELLSSSRCYPVSRVAPRQKRRTYKCEGGAVTNSDENRTVNVEVSKDLQEVKSQNPTIL